MLACSVQVMMPSDMDGRVRALLKTEEERDAPWARDRFVEGADGMGGAACRFPRAGGPAAS